MACSWLIHFFTLTPVGSPRITPMPTPSSPLAATMATHIINTTILTIFLPVSFLSTSFPLVPTGGEHGGGGVVAAFAIFLILLNSVHQLEDRCELLDFTDDRLCCFLQDVLVGQIAKLACVHEVAVALGANLEFDEGFLLCRKPSALSHRTEGRGCSARDSSFTL
jgi:hypothetical protein